jgi:hypothetical protein
MAIRTVPDGTHDADLFGTGLHGFTSGDAGALEPATIVSHFVMNHAQEEICRAVEGGGQVVTAYADSNAAQTAQDDGSMAYGQLDEVIRSAMLVASVDDDSSAILSGLQFTTSGVSLDVETSPGELLQNGRRYAITAAKISAQGYNTWTLPASRDSYFFIAHQDPADTDSNERTVYMETDDVANGAAAPATPAGMILFARLETNGSGVTGSTYFDHGKVITNDQGVGVRFKQPDGSTNEMNVLPFQSSNVDLGLREPEEASSLPTAIGTFRSLAVRQINLQGSSFPVGGNGYTEEYTRNATTLGSNDTTDIVLYDEDDFTDGTLVVVEAHAQCFDDADATDSAAFKARFLAQKDGGTFSLQSSGVGEPFWAEGNQGNGINAAPNITSGDLRLRLTGHNGASDICRWYCRFTVDIVTPDSDLP